MKYKKLWSLLIVLVMVSSTIFSSNELIRAESGMKYLKANQTTLGFKEIIYVDGANGNDTNGDGTRENPFATIVTGFNYMNNNCREDGAIVIADGVYDVIKLFTGGNDNMNPAYSGMKISLISENLGGATLSNYREWQVIQTSISRRIKLKFYGLRFTSNNIHLGADDWVNEYYNCLFLTQFGGANDQKKDASIYVENCLFTGAKNGCYSAYPLSGTAINTASATNYIDPAIGDKVNVLYNVTYDSDYNITSDGWQNAGTGTNPDGTKAHIGVYGGRFAWGGTVKEVSGNQLDMVLEVDEKLLLSVDDHLSENINMIWTSSDETVATVDDNGFVTALKPGETTITVKAKNGKYEDTINILVVEDADDYRLAVDLNIGESARATIDKNKHTANVTWTVADETVATVSSKGKITAQSRGLTIVTAIDENGKEVGQVYVRVR